MDENITYRNNNLFRTSSLPDITADNSDLFDQTMASLPNTSLNMSQTILDLQEKVKQLSSDLQSAHLEIENLNSENFRLKTDVQKYIKTISVYKKLNDIDLNNMTPCSERKHKSNQNNKVTPIRKNKQSITPVQHGKYKESTEAVRNSVTKMTKSANRLECNSTPTSELNSTPIHKVIRAELPARNSDQNIATDVLDCRPETSTELNHTTTNTLITLPKHEMKPEVRKKKVIIIADQQGRYIQRILQRLLGEDFIVRCFWKPGACLQEILTTETTEIGLLNKDDYVIVLGGVNDANPVLTKLCLSNFLHNTKNTNVMVSEVLFNTHLNEKMLNYKLKFICSHYNHSTYVDMNYSEYVPKYRFLPLHICQLLLKEILRNVYKRN